MTYFLKNSTDLFIVSENPIFDFLIKMKFRSKK